MKILSANIAMKSEHTLSKTSTKQQMLKAWSGNGDARTANQNNNRFAKSDTVTLSDQGKELLRQLKNDHKVSSPQKTGYTLSDKDKQKIQLLERLLEQLTGKKIKFSVMEDLKLDSSEALKLGNQLSMQQPQPQRAGWGIDFQSHQSHSETEQMSFEAKGMVKTSDGRQSEFDLKLELSRQFTTTTDISFKAGDALIDPLVINFDNASAHLSTDKMVFDLNNDGKNEQISILQSGSGFLAFDKNGDGLVNNGSELFGTKTGNGFGELSAYDADKNNWIDENDAIFDKLKIWTVDEHENKNLIAIGEKGIGAIYLGNVSTIFNIKNDENTLLGQVKSGSVFLSEYTHQREPLFY